MLPSIFVGPVPLFHSVSPIIFGSSLTAIFHLYQADPLWLQFSPLPSTLFIRWLSLLPITRPTQLDLLASMYLPRFFFTKRISNSLLRRRPQRTICVPRTANSCLIFWLIVLMAYSNAKLNVFGDTSLRRLSLKQNRPVYNCHTQNSKI